MQWQYRIILFEFQKEGLLGGQYVDDEAMEKTLNEQGGQGWELVNVSMITEGLLAFCKRPVEIAGDLRVSPVQERSIRQESSSPNPPVQGVATGRRDVGRVTAREIQEQEKEHIQELDRQRRKTMEDEESNLIGQIRIR